MAKPRRRGRPPTFKPRDRRHVADLIRQHGARGAVEAANKPISMSTVLKIAQEFGIELKKGRRPRMAA